MLQSRSMGDSMLIEGIEIRDFYSGIETIGNEKYRKDVCKLSGRFACGADLANTEQGRNTPYIRSCIIKKDGQSFQASTTNPKLNLADGTAYGFFYKSYHEETWHLGSLIEENFYQKLNIQECLPSDPIEIETIPDDFGEELDAYSSQEGVKMAIHGKEKEENFGNYFYAIILIWITIIIIFIKIFQKFRKKSPQK